MIQVSDLGSLNLIWIIPKECTHRVIKCKSVEPENYMTYCHAIVRVL